jgi:hypothetical protein
MDYQAGSSSKVVVGTRLLLTHVFVVALLFGTTHIFAQVAENPLTTDVTITAVVAEKYFAPLPYIPPPGPINMIDTSDVAVFRGFAYPGAVISLLRNGVVVTSAGTNNDGTFEVRLRGVSPGTYSFGIRAEDTNHLKSKLMLFTVYLSSGVTTFVDGIMVPPTVTSDYVEIRRGDPLTFTGQSIPNTTVQVSFDTDLSEVLKRVTAGRDGAWRYVLDTTPLTLGDHVSKALTINGKSLTLYSDPLSFRVVTTASRLRAKVAELSGFRRRCDLNNDGRVNLLDFSIMAFWYKRLGFPKLVDLNTDGNVNLTDLSILAYCWTG